MNDIRRVLVTGGGGFLGAWILQHLHRLGLSARIFDIHDHRQHAEAIAPGAADSVEWIVGDVSETTAVIEAARGCEGLDAGRVAAIGFCFGGLCVLDLARRGADLRGVVAFHGLLGAPEGLASVPVKARVLALQGHDDPMATPAQVLEFEQEMSARGADWQLHAYGNTLNAFTNPAAQNTDFGTQYDAAADRRSHAALLDFLSDIYG